MPEETSLVPSTPQAIEKKQEPQAGKLSRLGAFTPTNLTEAIALSKLIAGSELAPKDYKGKPANVLIAMQMGAEVGLAPMAALQNIAVINGRPSLWGDAALGIVQVSPMYEWHKEEIKGEGDLRTAFCQVKRKNQEPYTATFSVLQAKKAQLWGKPGPWQTYPDRMLQMRARGFALRDKFSDALRGLILAEEAMDIPPDTSEAKKKRDEATLDASVFAQSTEENRGHGNEGFQKQIAQESESQEPKKQDPVMCGHCGKIDSHEENCPHFKPNVPSQEGLVNARFTIAKKVVKAKKRAEKGGGDYLQIPVLAQDQSEFILYCFDTKFFPRFEGLTSGIFRCEYAPGKFPSLKHILSLNGKQFVNDEPSNAEGELIAPTSADLGFDEPQE